MLALETRQAKMKAAQDAGVAVERAKFIVQDALGTLRIVGARWRPRASRAT